MVIYRNPMEQWFWESGIIYYIVIVGVIYFLGCLAHDIYYNWKRNRK